MGAAAVGRSYFDVVVIPAAVWFLVLDTHIGEMNLAIEVRQFVFERPGVNLCRVAIGVAVVVVAVAIPLDVTREHVMRVDVALAGVMLAPRPTGVIVATAGVFVSVRVPRIAAWTAAKLTSIAIPIASGGLQSSSRP